MCTAAASKTLTVKPGDVFRLLQRPVSTEIKGSEQFLAFEGKFQQENLA